MNITLQRTARNSECTEGKMQLERVLLYTLELPWIADPGFPGGEPDKSCVPPGVYVLEMHNSVKHPKTFALVNRDLGVIHEPDPTFPNARVACLIHVANYPEDLEGCIGLGLSQQYCFIGASAAALLQFKSAVPWESGHTLEIIDPP
jgi:Family of unknown function (DUF5675)